METWKKIRVSPDHRSSTSSKSALLKFIAKPFLLTKGKKEGRKKGTKKEKWKERKRKSRLPCPWDPFSKEPFSLILPLAHIFLVASGEPK